jgi:hypothetical protein
MKKAYKFLLLALPVMFVAACGGGDDDFNDRADIADPKIRFVNVNPTSLPVTLYHNTSVDPHADGVGYKFASNYFDVSSDLGDWIIRVTGVGTEIGRFTFDPERGSKYTILELPGLINPELLLIRDPYNKGLTANNARVRSVNAASNATAAIDIYLTPVGADIATATPTIAGVAYKTAQPPDGQDSIDVDGGNYQLRITTTGTKTVIFDKPVTLAKNADWLVNVLPNSVLPNDVKVLVVKSDDSASTIELNP